jgi:hypothetical protein
MPLVLHFQIMDHPLDLHLPHNFTPYIILSLCDVVLVTSNHYFSHFRYYKWSQFYQEIGSPKARGFYLAPILWQLQSSDLQKKLVPYNIV